MRKFYLSLILLFPLFLKLEGQTARIQIIHNSPSPTVDIYVEGELLEDDFAFREATAFMDIPAGVELNIGVALANSESVNDTLFNFLVTLEEGKTYVATAGGIAGDETTPFTLMVNDMGREAADAADQVVFTALHGSPDAPNVDVDARGVGTLVTDLAYGEYTEYQSVPADNYYLDVRGAGSPDVVATFRADLSGLGGGAATVFASGFLGAEPAFGLFAALPDGTVLELPAVQVARVQIIHNSPSPTVDIYANGDLLRDDLPFRGATPFLTVPAGVEIDIAVAPENSMSADDAIAVFENVVFDNVGTYVVVATGVVDDETTPFDLAIYDMGRETAAGDGVDLLLYHGSPDAPEVDVVVRGGDILFDNVSYKEFQGYVSVPADNYVLEITPADDNETVVYSVAAELLGFEGDAITVFASGYLQPPGDSDPGFEVWVALADGITIGLNASSANDLGGKLDYMTVSPNPVADLAQVRFAINEMQTLNLRIYDATGRLVRSQHLGKVMSGEHNFEVDVNGMARGIYTVSLISDEGVATRRVVVAN